MYPDRKEAENAKFYLQGQRNIALEMQTFAAQHDMLEMYTKATNAIDHFNTAIAVLEEKIKALSPQPAGR